MKRFQRILSLFCTAALCLGLFPTMALLPARAAVFEDYHILNPLVNGYTHVLEIVTGENGLDLKDTSTASLTADIYYFTKENPKRQSVTVELEDLSQSGAFDALSAYLDLTTPTLDNGGLVTSGLSFDELTDTQMHTLMASYTGQRNRGGHTAALRPYSATYLGVNLGTSSISSGENTYDHIDAIELKLPYGWSDSVSIQSVRLLEIVDYQKNFWNGGYSQERIRGMEALVLAETPKGKTLTLSNTDSLVLSANTTDYPNTIHYNNVDAYLEQITQAELDAYLDVWDDTTWRTMVVSINPVSAGITLDIANHAEAGLETLMAYRKENPEGSTRNTPAASALASVGTQALNAYENLGAITDNPLKLKITYTDEWGRTRQVSIPFIGVYLAYMMLENGGNLSGNTDYKTWISGIMLQGQTVGFPFNLADFQTLVSIELTYGLDETNYMVNNTTTDGSHTLNSLREIDCEADTLSVESLSFYVGEDVKDAFSCKYNASRGEAVTTVKEGLIPDYSYTAPTWRGSTLADNTSLVLAVNRGKLLPGAPSEHTLKDTYLITITSSAVDKASSYSLLTLDLSYVDTNGNTMTLEGLDTRDLVGQQYGYTHRQEYESTKQWWGAPTAFWQYDQRVDTAGEPLMFYVEIPDVDHFVSVKFSLSSSYTDGYKPEGDLDSPQADINKYQLQSLYIHKLDSLGARRGSSTFVGSIRLMEMEFNTDEVPCAFTNRQLLLQAASPTATLNLTYVDSNGNMVVPETELAGNDYLQGMPSSMTYEDTLKDLGLAIPKFTYQVGVTVANTSDAGSANHFFFQLVFEHGTSAVVLANQQLASDSFRQGETEFFQIQTTQNYGDLISLRIICDSATSNSDVFDKLNIESVTVKINGTNGVLETWTIDNIGWIDIAYADENSAYYNPETSDVSTITQQNNAALLKEYPVTGSDVSVELQFCISTAANSSSEQAKYAYNVLGGSFHVSIAYTDRNGRQRTETYDLVDLLQEYNGNEDIDYLFRPNHVDRFTLSLADVKNLDSITFTRSEGLKNWVVKSVSVQLITGKSDVYIGTSVVEHVVTGEFIRNVESSVELTNTSSVDNVTISGKGSKTLYFTEHTISVAPNADTDSWDATITRVPQVTNDTLNIYLIPGAPKTAPDEPYVFDQNSPGITALLKYTTIYGGNAVQTAYDLETIGHWNGKTVLYAAGVPADAMSSLCSMTLDPDNSVDYQNAPIIDYAIVEQVRNGVIVDTYKLFYSTQVSTNQERTPKAGEVYNPMKQTVRLQLAENQKLSLTAEEHDVAVALQYFSDNDPNTKAKRVYRSPYIYLTDQEYTALVSGTDITLDFAVGNISQVVGLTVVTTGPIVEFSKAVIYNYSADGTTLLDTCSLTQAFTATTTEKSVSRNAVDIVVPATFEITTAPDSQVAGAGVSGQVSMVITYLDSAGQEQTETITDLVSLISDGQLAAGTTIQLPLLLANAETLQSVTLMPISDNWFISSVTATLSPTGGIASTCTTSVNNWAKPLEPLTIDVRPAELREEGIIGNQIQNFAVNGQAQSSQDSAQAASGTVLQLQAYANDRVNLVPVVTAVGTPDTSVIWNTGELEQQVILHIDGSATFAVPEDAAPGSSYSLSVSCTGDSSLQVSVTITVVEVPAVEDPDPPAEDPSDPVDPTPPAEDPTEPADPTPPAEDPTEPVDPTLPAEDPTDPTVPSEPTTPTIDGSGIPN